MPSDDASGGLRVSFDPESIRYPVSFELRLIVKAAEAEALRKAVPAALDSGGIAHGPVSLAAEAGKSYAKARLSVTFMDQGSMRAAYAALAALPGVKAVI